MVTPNQDLYPSEYRHAACLKRVFDYPDLPDLDLASKSKMPPTKIQISVLDVLPAVWAAQFVPVTATPRKAPRVSLNAGLCFLFKLYRKFIKLYIFSNFYHYQRNNLCDFSWINYVQKLYLRLHEKIPH